MAVCQLSRPPTADKQVDNESDALLASARSASEVPRTKATTNVAAPLRKSASGATFARLRVTPAPDGGTGEPPSPRLQTEVDASYCSYDYSNMKNVGGNQSPVSRTLNRVVRNFVIESTFPKPTPKS